MPGTQRIQFSTDIAAPVATVFRLMLDADGYRHWTQPFAEGSHYVGRWQAGEKIRFVSPSGDGMVSEIAELRPDKFVSIRHLGYVSQGVEDTQSEAVAPGRLPTKTTASRPRPAAPAWWWTRTPHPSSRPTCARPGRRRCSG